MPAPVPEALAKARAYCARQERCQQEVRDKLYGWGAHKGEVEPIIARLIAERYLDEKRFAEHFAVSKFRQKGWGRRKIQQAMQQKRVSAPCIRFGLQAIDVGEYRAMLAKLLRKQLVKLRTFSEPQRQMRTLRYLSGRGFETDLVRQAMGRGEED
ncbi:MAG: RecX family transcriptional regulator [Flavobacteriales bacterium]|nr:RecX family transcriptional regulator [Flavobacteriales bacterium]